MEKKEKTILILVDNLRYDQWKILEKDIRSAGTIEMEDLYYSILPTATQYSRNAIFAGLMPQDIYQLYPDLWVFDEEEGGKNLKEKELVEKQLNRMAPDVSFNYNKVNNQRTGKKLTDNSSNLLQFDFNVIIYNFVDMLSHARTDTEMIKELAGDEAAYRSLTASWFNHSYLFDLLKKLSGSGVRVILTTDHGYIRVENPVKVIGDRKTSTNLRYKLGKNLNYSESDVFAARDPESIRLPKTQITSSYIFAMENDFLAYPNNYNYFVNYYRNTFQHGGISMEEMLIPIISLKL